MIKQNVVKTETSFKKVKDEYLKKDLKYGVLVLCGKEKLFKKALIASIHSNIFSNDGDSEMNYSIYYDKNDSIGFSPLDVADTPPFGSNLRLITIYGYENFNEDFLEYAINPSKTSLVILESEHKLEDDPLYKYFLNKNSDSIYFIDFPLPDEKDFKNLITAYISKFGKKISLEALEYMINNINLDYNSLYSELSKICDYNSEKEYLSLDDIKDFTHISKNKSVFDFLDAVFERDRKKCFTIMSHLEKDATGSLTLMMNNFIALYYMKIFAPQTTLNEISKITKIPIFILTKKKPAVANFTIKEITSIISKILRLNILNVTAPQNVFKAHFDMLLFTITK